MPTPLKAGEVLRNRYKISRIIGQGGMGSIYLADDIRLEGRQCALKEVEHDRSLPPEMLRQARDQFLREATVLARLDHPNLPKVSDFFSIGGRDYLIMDYVSGKNLRVLMKEAQQEEQFLVEEDVLSWADQLIDALTYLHKQNPPIVHRDIKPSNLILTSNGILKLVDFGLVKLLASDEMTVTIIQGRGTAMFTPLEQYGGDIGHTDVRSDIYSFGATLYQLLTNQSPVEARERFLKPDSLPLIRQINPEVRGRTERAILWAMNLHPDERPQTINDFRSALIGDSGPLMTRPRNGRLPRPQSFRQIFNSPLEQILLWMLAGLTIVSLMATLLR